MAKKDKKSTKKKDGDVVDAVRGAVERTFQATAGQTEQARDRGRSLLDEVASAAQRIRESFDDLRVLEDVRGLRAEIEALSRRVAELEKKQAAAPARKPAAAKTTTARKPPAKAPAKPSAASTAAMTTGPKAKPTATPRRKPAAPRSTSAGGS
jgi:cell division septation protein DedD